MIPGGAVPAYPALLRSAGVAGAVLVEFVVDTLGRVEPGSLRLVHADHELFAASVRDVAPRLRFLPAEAQGRQGAPTGPAAVSVRRASRGAER